MKFYTRKLSASALALVCCGTLVSGSVYGMKRPQDNEIQISKTAKKREITIGKFLFLGKEARTPTKREITREQLLSLGEEAFTNVIQSKELSEEYITNFMFDPFNEDMRSQAEQEFLEVILTKAIGILTTTVDIAEQKETKAAFNVRPLYHVLNVFFLENDATLKNETALKRTSLGTWSTKYFDQLKDAFEIYAEEMKVSVIKTNTLLKSLKSAYDQEGVKLGYFSLLPKPIRQLINAYVPGKLKVNHLFENEIKTFPCCVKIKEDVTKEQFLKVLESKPKLKILDLSTNLWFDDFLKCLSEVLNEKTSIEKLDMSGSRTSITGIQYLSEALKTNKNINILDLSNTSIGSKAMEHLSIALKENTTLTSLKLSNNNLSEKIKTQLKDMFPNVTHLEF